MPGFLPTPKSNSNFFLSLRIWPVFLSPFQPGIKKRAKELGVLHPGSSRAWAGLVRSHRFGHRAWFIYYAPQWLAPPATSAPLWISLRASGRCIQWSCGAQSSSRACGSLLFVSAAHWHSHLSWLGSKYCRPLAWGRVKLPSGIP